MALTLRRGRAPFENELRRYSAQCCTTVREIVSYSGPGMIVDCKDPYLQDWILKLNNTPQTRGYTMKVEQRRPLLKPDEIYSLAHENFSEREALERLNKGDTTTVTYTHRPSHNKTAVNAVNADATATLTPQNPLTPPSTPWVTLNLRRRKPSTPGLKCHLRFGLRVPNIGKHINKRRWTCLGLIGVPPIAPFGRVSLILHAMTLIGALRVSVRVLSLRMVVALRAAVAVRVAAATAIREERERRTGAAIGRSAQRRPFERRNPQAPL